MPSSSTTDCSTMTTAASSQPAGSDSANGNTTKELRVPRLKANVRPWSAGSYIQRASSLASTAAASRKTTNTGTTVLNS